MNLEKEGLMKIMSLIQIIIKITNQLLNKIKRDQGSELYN